MTGVKVLFYDLLCMARGHLLGLLFYSPKVEVYPPQDILDEFKPFFSEEFNNKDSLKGKNKRMNPQGYII